MFQNPKPRPPAVPPTETLSAGDRVSVSNPSATKHRASPASDSVSNMPFMLRQVTSFSTTWAAGDDAVKCHQNNLLRRVMPRPLHLGRQVPERDAVRLHVNDSTRARDAADWFVSFARAVTSVRGRPDGFRRCAFPSLRPSF